MSTCRVTHLLINEYNPDYRVMKEAHSLKKNYEVMIIALNNKEFSKKTIEEEDGVEIYRISLKTRKFNNKLLLPLKYFEAVIKSFKMLIKLKPNVIHCHDFPALPLGYVGKMFLKCKLIYDSHEYLADSNATKKFPKILKKIIAMTEDHFAKKSDSIITVSNGISNLLYQRIKVIKPNVILNAPYSIKGAKPKYINIREKFNIKDDEIIITYIGGILPSRGMELILEAFVRLNEKKLHLLLIGNEQFPTWLTNNINIKPVEKNIHFIPPVHPTKVLSIASQADIGIHAIRGDSLNHQFCMPNKLFEYIQSGLALLMTDLVELKQVIEENNIGLTFKDGNVSDLVEKIKYMVNHPEKIEQFKSNSTRLAQEMHWENEEKKLLTIYKELI